MEETKQPTLPQPSEREIDERIANAVEEFQKAVFWRAGQLWGKTVDPRVREHPRVTLIEGSSVADDVVERIRAVANGRKVMLNLDSDTRRRTCSASSSCSGTWSPPAAT
jgi:hypothetical protein